MSGDVRLTLPRRRGGAALLLALLLLLAGASGHITTVCTATPVTAQLSAQPGSRMSRSLPTSAVLSDCTASGSVTNEGTKKRGSQRVSHCTAGWKKSMMALLTAGAVFSSASSAWARAAM